MGWFKRDRKVNQDTNEFARLAGVSTMDAKRTLMDMSKIQGVGISELMVIGIATMRKIDEKPQIELDELNGFLHHAVFSTGELTFSDGMPINQGVITEQEVVGASAAAIRLYRKDYLALVQQRMKDQQDEAGSQEP